MLQLSVLTAYTVSALAAFLLFVLQPVVSKTILPILGGTPAVWNACMVSFQLLLLSGYLYAHALGKIRSLRVQVAIHALLFILCILTWQLSADALRTDTVTGDPLWWVVTRLLSTAGTPFFLIAATAPLLQRWVSLGKSSLAGSPYRLYSASNAGSLTGLLGFILFIEPAFTLPQLFGNWAILFVLCASLLIALGLSVSIAPATAAAAHARAAPPSRNAIAGWIGLALIPSSLMLGVTTYITTDIAAIPLLWLAPLCLYLLSFIAAFSERVTGANTARACVIVCALALVTYAISAHGFTAIYLLHLISFAIACFALHGMLALHKPEPAHLTLYYLCISFGGFLGGTFNSLIAPHMFSGIAEYPLMLAAAILVMLFKGAGNAGLTRPLPRISLVFIIISLAVLAQSYVTASQAFLSPAICAALIGIGICLLAIACVKQRDFRHIMYLMIVALPIALLSHTRNTADAFGAILFKERNFYGSLYVKDQPEQGFRFLQYNTTMHGGQRTEAGRTLDMTTYYPNAMAGVEPFLPAHGAPYRKAVIGLGTGMMQCANGPADHTDFYEINPAVTAIAENPAYFTFLSECPGSYSVVMGDGRLEIAKAADAGYDLIIVDAFSSDAIPSHLLTTQALGLYRQKLKPNGVLYMHISNRHMNLRPLLALQIREIGGIGFFRSFKPRTNQPHTAKSDWFIAMFDDRETFTDRARKHGWKPVAPLGNARPWTDDYSNLIPYLVMFRAP